MGYMHLDDVDKELYGKLIREERLKAGISMADAADLISVNRFTWSKWEYGQRHPMRAIAEAAVTAVRREAARRAKAGVTPRKPGRPPGEAPKQRRRS